MVDEAPSPSLTPDATLFQIQHGQALGISHYCNHMLVQGDGGCLYLHFYQIRPPIILPLEPQQGIPIAKAEPITSIAVDLDGMQEFIDVMQNELNRIKAIRDANATQ